MQQAVFAAGSHHPVWFICAFRDKVIDQNTDISVTPAQNQRRFSLQFQCSVDACNEALNRSLFISGRAVELACSVQAADFLAFQCRI